MIQIPEKSDLDEIEKKVAALCAYLNVRLLSQATTTGEKYIAGCTEAYEPGWPQNFAWKEDK